MKYNWMAMIPIMAKAPNNTTNLMCLNFIANNCIERIKVGILWHKIHFKQDGSASHFIQSE
jgi:hypothetical protein